MIVDHLSVFYGEQPSSPASPRSMAEILFFDDDVIVRQTGVAGLGGDDEGLLSERSFHSVVLVRR